MQHTIIATAVKTKILFQLQMTVKKYKFSILYTLVITALGFVHIFNNEILQFRFYKLTSLHFL